MPATVAHEAAEQDVAGGLQASLAGHDPVAMGRLCARAEEPFQDRRLGLLDLEEERIVVRPVLEQHHERPQPDAPDADHLHRVIDDRVAVEQDAAVLLQRLPVAGQRRHRERVGHVVAMDDDRRSVDDPALAVDQGGQLRELVERVVVRG